MCDLSSHRVVKDGKISEFPFQNVSTGLLLSTYFTEVSGLSKTQCWNDWERPSIARLACEPGGAYVHVHVSWERSPSIQRFPRGLWLQRSEGPKSKPGSLISQKWKPRGSPSQWWQRWDWGARLSDFLAPHCLSGKLHVPSPKGSVFPHDTAQNVNHPFIQCMYTEYATGPLVT